MKTFSVMDHNGIPFDVKAERFYIDNGDLVFTVGPQNTEAIAKGYWQRVSEVK